MMMNILRGVMGISVIAVSGALLTGCPTALFTATPSSGIAPLDVSFKDASVAGMSVVTDRFWDFGDGSTSVDKNPSHTYAAGTYTVSLTVTNSLGSDIVTKTACITAVKQTVWYVSPTGTGSGKSWNDPLGSIQNAVDAAWTAGGGEVWVAEGTYVAGTVASKCVVEMAENVHLYGGFSGDETALQFRDWENHGTIIDGEGARTGVYGANNATFDGFTVINGYAKRGGGMYNYECSPAVTNCTFTNNIATTSGAGMQNSYQSSPTVSNCTFATNTAEGLVGHGGGISNDDHCSPTITHCTFKGNTAPGVYVALGIFAGGDGGGLANILNSCPVITECTFTQNIAVRGGGIHTEDWCAPQLANCTFTANVARNSGGGMCNLDESDPTVNDCTFDKNTAKTGGGMSIWGNADVYGHGTLVHCIFAGNQAARNGGGLYLANCTNVHVSAEFSSNTAGEHGGGVYSVFCMYQTIWPVTYANNSAGISDDDKYCEDYH